ncbi:hypothetical protein CR513_60154, partial [Mucuna pruriens]
MASVELDPRSPIEQEPKPIEKLKSWLVTTNAQRDLVLDSDFAEASLKLFVGGAVSIEEAGLGHLDQ